MTDDLTPVIVPYGMAAGSPSVSKDTLPQTHYPWIAQQDETDCGLAALTMIARAHGLDVSLPEVRRRAVVEPQGCSLAGLQRVAESLGFGTRAVRLGLERLAEMPLPALAHLSDGHFVVVYALTPGSVILGDPAHGIVEMGLWQFQRTWSGALLLIGSKESEWSH